MQQSEMDKLDNPVWNALSETHQEYALERAETKCYHPDYCPFGATRLPYTGALDLQTYSKMETDFFMVGYRPAYNHTVILKNELVCLQMIAKHKIESTSPGEIVKLEQRHHTEVWNLVNLVQPGYFKRKTVLLGNYFGIFKNEKLIAVAGERMQLHHFIEVSAVVTHPDHTGKGYAGSLVSHTVNAIYHQGKQPFLHVVETNGGAIRLYEKLGFIIRRKISFWHFTSVNLK